MPNGTTIEKPNAQSAERIMASTLLPEQGDGLLTTPRPVITPRVATREVSKIQGEANQAQTEIDAQAEAVGEAEPPVSVVDYLASQGQPSSFSERNKLAEQFGIANYTGTAEQNIRLLGILQNQPAPTEMTDEERRQKEMTDAIGGAFTPEQYEANPYLKKPDETTEEYNIRVEALRASNIPEPTEPTEPPPTTPTDDLMKTLRDELDVLDQAYEDYKARMTQLQNGTFPLSPDEQGQIDSINRIFDEIKAQQITANKNFEASINIAGISAGRQRYAPETHLGNVKQAVDDGIKKIAELDTKRLSTLSELKLAIRDKNYKQIGDAYDRFRQYVADKTTILEGIYNVAQAEQDKIDSFIAEQNKLIQEENQRVKEERERILEEATGNLAPQEIISNIMNAKTIEDAIVSAGSYLQTGTGDVGEYLFYKRQRELQGLPVVDFTTYQRTSKATTKTERDKSLRMEALNKAREELTKSLKRKPAVGVSLAPELDISKEYAPSDLYLQLRTDYSTLIGDPDEFDDAFSYLLSPTDRKKYGIGFLKTEETFSSQLKLVRQTLQNYIDEGYSRKEVEKEYMISNGVNEIPPSIEKILDELYG